MIPEPDPVDQRDPMNPFCPWKGANFKLKCRKVDGYPNYDQSDFSTPEALFGGDDSRIEELWKSQYSLTELVKPENFKSYEELKRRLDRVLGLSASAKTENVVTVPSATTKASVTESVSDMDLDSNASDTTDDADISDDLSYLQQLANED